MPQWVQKGINDMQHLLRTSFMNCLFSCTKKNEKQFRFCEKETEFNAYVSAGSASIMELVVFEIFNFELAEK